VCVAPPRRGGVHRRGHIVDSRSLRTPRTGHDVRVTVDDLSTAMSRFDHAVQHRDRRAAEDVLDEDYALVLVHPAPARMPRARWLEVLEDYVVHSYSVEQQSVDQSDDVAAVLSRVRMQATVLGEDRSGLFVISDVWRLRDGRWRVWRRHSSPLTAGGMPGT
jgi:ketosteroid isomerase-like protein